MYTDIIKYTRAIKLNIIQDRVGDVCSPTVSLGIARNFANLNLAFSYETILYSGQTHHACRVGHLTHGYKIKSIDLSIIIVRLFSLLNRSLSLQVHSFLPL